MCRRVVGSRLASQGQQVTGGGTLKELVEEEAGAWRAGVADPAL